CSLRLPARSLFFPYTTLFRSADHVGRAEHGGGGGAATGQPGAARVQPGSCEHHAAEGPDARLTGGQPAAHQPEGDDGGGADGGGGLDRGAHGPSLRPAGVRSLKRCVVAHAQRTTAMPCAGTWPGAAGPTPSRRSAPLTVSSTSPGAGRGSSPRFSTRVRGAGASPSA